MNKSSLIGALAVMTAISPFGRAQISPNSDNAIGDFTIERVLTPSSITSPFAPNFPPPVLAGLQNGSIEIHQVFAYNSAQHTVDQTAFVVPGKSPLPFPSPGSAPIGDHYIIRVDSARITAQPGASVVVTGKVISNDVPTPRGDITGAIITISFAYQGSGPGTHFGPVFESVSPFYGLYTAIGVGNMSLTPSAQACSAATLNGVYMFSLQGSLQAGPTTFLPFAETGRFFADGQGSLTVIDSGNGAGSVFTDRTFPITYVLDQLCSGTFKWSGGAMNVVVSKDGQHVNMTFTYPSSVVVNGSGQIQ